ncbi:hypothetical protein ACET3Z_024066 [Daucus carota]
MARISSTAYQLCYLLVVTGILQCMFSQVVAEDTHSPVIKFLPGFRGPLPFRFQTGYVGVGESEDVQLFYYFVESQRNPREDPLLLWMTGGPGCSSFTALAYQIGPLNFEQEKYDGTFPTLILNPYSWTKRASIIFLDFPVGTGFSYGRTATASRSTDTQAYAQVFEFLRKWLVGHSEFLLNPFYVAGDSFAGVYVAVISQMISDGNEAGLEPSINFKGYLAGNPVTFRAETNFSIPFSHGMGLISDELYESLRRSCGLDDQKADPDSAECSRSLETFNQLTDGLNQQQILEKACGEDSVHEPRRSLSDWKRAIIDGSGKTLLAETECHVEARLLSVYWINDESVQKALHIRKGTVGTWARCNQDTLAFEISVLDVRAYHANLSTKGYRSLIFSGDHDFVVPFLSTQAWIRALNYSIIDEWRQWIVEDQVAGYTRTYSNKMTFATVKGGGHAASENKPAECFVMAERCQVKVVVADTHSPAIKFLPGFPGPLPFRLETGYVGVDKSEDVQLFYYFVESQRKPKEDPVILWMTGGPGCSSFSGLAMGIGPIYFKEVPYDGTLPTLLLNPDAWTKTASMIFLDYPVGTGFSYGRTSIASRTDDNQAASQAVQFVRKWLVSHPEFLSNPFYVGGDSYAGIFVPIITQMMSNGNEAGLKPSINLKGYIAGNPKTFPAENNFSIPFSHGKGLISDELYESLIRSCGFDLKPDPDSTECTEAFEAYNQCIDGINSFDILDINCPIDLPLRRLLSNENRVFSDRFGETSLSAQSISDCLADAHELFDYWFNDEKVRNALHTRKKTIETWTRCGDVEYDGQIKDVRPYHANLSTKGYRSLIYSGDNDWLVPFQSTQAWIRGLNYSIFDDWRRWIVEDQIAGYTRTYSNKMTFATVKGGSHTAPDNRPAECYAMFERWVSEKPL